MTRKRRKDRSGDRFIYVKQVPKRYAEVVQAACKPYPLVRIALRTDVRTEAEDKARRVERELVRCVLSLADGRGNLPASPAVAEADLGTVPEALPSLREAFDEYLVEVASRHTNKSEAQRKKWRALRDRSIARFLEVMGRDDMPIGEIDRDAARKFRKFWQDRIAQGYTIDAANEEIGVLSDPSQPGPRHATSS